MSQVLPPTLSAIKDARTQLGDRVKTTPTTIWRSPEQIRLLGADTEVWQKLELLQYGGSFKPRGAILNMEALDQGALKKGVTAVSAGNHAIAVGFAAQQMNTHAKVVMPNNANPLRIATCQAYGAEVVLVENVTEAFAEVDRIQQEEGRTFIHPFDGPVTALGTATVGLEWIEQSPVLDAIILPIGGGGLAAGIASAFAAGSPQTEIFGVEPYGADTMTRSFASGKPESIDKVRTIADSLGAPFSMEYSMSLCRQLISEIVLVDDDLLRRTMRLMAHDAKLCVEPAGAASMAALLGPLRSRLMGKKVGILVCGANIDPESHYSLIKDAAEIR